MLLFTIVMTSSLFIFQYYVVISYKLSNQIKINTINAFKITNRFHFSLAAKNTIRNISKLNDKSKERFNTVSLPKEGVRLNKCLVNLSRRSADEAITEGRVTINSKQAKVGDRVFKNDIIRLDGQIQQWEAIAEAKQSLPDKELDKRNFVYLKYWKPVDVTCTSDKNDKYNIISAGQFDLFPQRLFTVGRLDKESTGLILLTSDGRVNNAILSPSMNKEKVYRVQFDRAPTDQQVQSLRDGVVITAPIQRDGSTKLITAKTLPCKVIRVGTNTSKFVDITLVEGRNRQIRRMAEEVGLRVVSLHRTSFCGITLKGISEGNWKELTSQEMEIILKSLKETTISKSIDDDYIE